MDRRYVAIFIFFTRSNHNFASIDRFRYSNRLNSYANQSLLIKKEIILFGHRNALK
jgi:hypothetical protein